MSGLPTAKPTRNLEQLKRDNERAIRGAEAVKKLLRRA
jgi:hypothetical protein